MCMTQSSWSPSAPGALRNNHGSPRTNYLTDLFLISRCPSGQQRTGPSILTFASLEVEPTNTPNAFRGGRSPDSKRAFQVEHFGASGTSEVLSSTGKKRGPGAQSVTEDETISGKPLQLRRPSVGPRFDIASIDIEDPTKCFDTPSEGRNSQIMYRKKTLEFRRGEHPSRETRPSARSVQLSRPLVEEAVAALQLCALNSGHMDAVMERYHGISRTDISGILTEFQLRKDWRGAVQFFKWMKCQTWYAPLSRQYTRLIGFLGREGQVDLACSHFQEMLIEKCKPDQYTYTAMLNAYGKARMYDEALAVFSYMKAASNANCKPTTVTCNALVDSLIKGGKYDLAFKIFIEMKEGDNGLDVQCKPNSVTYNILIDGLCRENHVESAFQMIYNMSEGDDEHAIEPNVSTYNTLINACGKNGLYDKAEKLLEHMLQHGHEPDRITYTALIDAYGKAGKWECAENMFRGMRNSDIQVDVMAYTAMIDAYASVGQLEKAEGLVKMMRGSGVRPNQVTYLALIDAYGRSGLPLEAKEAFNSIEKEGHRANVLHYSSLIIAFGKANMYAEAANVYDTMKMSGCQPNLVTLAAVLASMKKCHSWDDAKVLRQCFQTSGSELEHALYNLLTAEETLWEPALQTLDNIKESTQLRKSLYNALMDLFWHFEMKTRAAKVVSLAKRHGIYTDEHFKEEWRLDLHGLSVGGAMVALLQWIDGLHVAWLWGENLPARLRIITGKGKHSRGKTSVLKDPVENLLLELHAPFVGTEADYGGFLLASGDSVRAWLSTPGINQKLQLNGIRRKL